MLLSDIVGANSVLNLAKLKSTKNNKFHVRPVPILRTTTSLIQVKKLSIVFKKVKVHHKVFPILKSCFLAWLLLSFLPSLIFV